MSHRIVVLPITVEFLVTTHRPFAKTARERFMQAAAKELEDFERKEQEFRKGARQEESEKIYDFIEKRGKADM